LPAASPQALVIKNLRLNNKQSDFLQVIPENNSGHLIILLMVRMILLSFLFLSSYFTPAQDLPDSLINKIDGTQRIPTLNENLFKVVEHGVLRKLDPDRAHWDELTNRIAEEVVKRADKFPIESRTAVYAHMGEVLIREKTNGPGYTYIQKALVMAKKLSGAPLVYTYYKYGEIFRAFNRMDSAIYYAEKALEEAYKLNSDSTVRESINQLASFCYISRDYSKADFYLRQSINHPLSDERHKRNQLNTLGLSFEYRDMLDSARFYFEQSLQKAIALKDTTWIGLTSGNIGYTYFLQNKYDEALKGLLIDVKYSLKKRNKMSAINAIGSIIPIYLMRGNKSMATKYYDTLSSLMTGEHGDKVWLNYYRSAADYFSKIGKPDSAYKYLLKHVELNNKAGDEKYNLNAAQLEAQFQFDRQIRQIGELERANLAQAEENRLKNYFLIATGIMILMAIGLIYGQYRNNKFKTETNKILQDQNEKISRQAAHLEELNATKDKLFAIIGHDLRGPINSLKMLLTMLKSQMISKEEFDVFMVKVQSGIDQVQLTLNNLLQWSSSQLAGMSTNPEAVDVANIVIENFDLLNEQAAGKKISLQNNIQPDCQVVADPDHLRLVFRNLVSNGIKFTSSGGRIMVENTRQNGHQIISVRDTGIGMSEQTRVKIFHSTATQSTSGTEGEKGTGLGLLLCQEVIEKNGGKIWVESEQGKGTVFKFSLPVVA
jgi:signal transduction histidine kinase